MAHHTARGAYRSLVERLNRFSQGAPPRDLLYRILELLFTEREAALVAQLPIKPFTVPAAARIWKVRDAEARATLDELASRGLLLDISFRGEPHFVLPPPMAGFFEFSMMRVRADLDQKLLAELFYQYLNVEEDFVRELFVRGRTQLGRVFAQEPALAARREVGGTEEPSLHVLDHERASEVIRSASHIGVGVCYCRHKMEHVGRACDAPMDICMTFNAAGRSLVAHGVARSVDRAEALELLARAWEAGLVQFGENVREEVNFICHCCGCCCEALLAARRFAFHQVVHTSSFVPTTTPERCTGCGRCVTACPVDALSLTSAHDPQRPRRRLARLDEARCLGCGVCVRACRHGCIGLLRRPGRAITPRDTLSRTVVMAIERGTLADLLFDNRALRSHRLMAAVLGVILDLPPIERALASGQLDSRYVERLVDLAGPLMHHR